MSKSNPDVMIARYGGVEPVGEVCHLAPALQWRRQNDCIAANGDWSSFIRDDHVYRQGEAPESAPWRLCDCRVMVSWQQHPCSVERLQGYFESSQRLIGNRNVLEAIASDSTASTPRSRASNAIRLSVSRRAARKAPATSLGNWPKPLPI